MHSSFVALNEHDLDAFVSCWAATSTETVCIYADLCKTFSRSAKSAVGDRSCTGLVRELSCRKIAFVVINIVLKTSFKKFACFQKA